MRKYILLTTIATVVLAGIAYAADCTSVSDSVTETKCKNLGYTMTASQCSGRNMVKCPLNTNWVWCGDGSATGTTTPSCTYTYTDTSKADKNGGSCTKDGTTYYEKNCNTNSMTTSDGCMSGRTFTLSCETVTGVKYGTCGACSSGYNGTAVCCDSNYRYTSCPENASCSICEEGRLYWFHNCYSGYNQTTATGKLECCDQKYKLTRCPNGATCSSCGGLMYVESCRDNYYYDETKGYCCNRNNYGDCLG